MAITNVALQDKIGGAPGQPTYEDVVTLNLDNNYPAGGYDFSVGAAARTLLDAQIGKGKTILSVKQNNSPGTSKVYAVWTRATQRLVMLDWTGTEYAGASDLSSVVGLELVITSK